MSVTDHCLAATVGYPALQALLEAGGRGTYRDQSPWLVARDLFREAEASGRRLPILFAAGSPSRYSHWGFVESIEVVGLHRSAWETACRFSALQPVNPLFEEIDSVFLKPTAEQAARERLEGIRRHRYPVTEAELRPYAICETPPFILKGLHPSS